MFSKKTLLLLAGVLLLASACNIPVPAKNNQPANDNPANVYTNDQYKVRVDYTGAPVQTETPPSYLPVQSNLPEGSPNILSLYLNPSFATGTNLESAWFNLAVNPNISQNTCYTSSQDKQVTVFNKLRMVQGNEWHYGTPNPVGGVAAGHSSLTETYRLYKNNTCYEVALFTYDFNRQNLPNPDSIKDYNVSQVFGALGQVFNQLEVK